MFNQFFFCLVARVNTGSAVQQCSTEGLALCPRCHLAWASEGTPVGPGKDTHSTLEGLNSRKAVGGPFGSDSRYTANMVSEQVVKNR